MLSVADFMEYTIFSALHQTPRRDHLLVDLQVSLRFFKQREDLFQIGK